MADRCDLKRTSKFSYLCNACGRCCHDKVITLSPFDVLRIARAAGISTRQAVSRFTIRRGSILRFTTEGACAALDGVRCTLHRGRPLACRIYPLGIERNFDGTNERIVRLDPAPGSAGVYGTQGRVADFLAAQGVPEYLAINDRYRPLIALFRERVNALVDFEKTEPREFWRQATREALAESGYDENPLIDALFDSGGAHSDIDAAVRAHIEKLTQMAHQSDNAAAIAAAAVMLAVSLGYPPAAAFDEIR